MKIAVCDDSREDRSGLRALLEACGQDFEIREYGSGQSLCGGIWIIYGSEVSFSSISTWTAWTGWKRRGR